jgi:hypothetical protein
MSDRGASVTRRDYIAAVVSRAEKDARVGLKGLAERWERAAFWLSLLIFVIIGGSAVWAWSLVGFPSWVAIAIVIVLLVLALGEAAYREWRDLETRVTSGDVAHLGGSMTMVHISPVENVADAYEVAFDRTNLEGAEDVTASPDRETWPKPNAVRFDRPASRLVKAGDLPIELKARNGLRRYSLVIHRFIPGGFVLDSRGCPLAVRTLACSVYFPEDQIPKKTPRPAELASPAPGAD